MAWRLFVAGAFVKGKEFGVAGGVGEAGGSVEELRGMLEVGGKVLGFEVGKWLERPFKGC